MSKKNKGKKKKRSKKYIDTGIEKMLEAMNAYWVRNYLQRKRS